MLRNEIAKNKEYCGEAFELYGKFEKFEYEINSKDIQTIPDNRSIETQTDIIYQEKSIQCNIQKDTGMYGSQNEISAYSDENDNKSVALSESESGVVVTLIQMIIKMI